MNWRLFLHRIAYASIQNKMGQLVTLGDLEQWTILPTLNSESFVVSGGAGNDISFEIDLIKRFDCCVALFDPSLPGKTTVGRHRDLSEKLRFFEAGIAAATGTNFLKPPTQDRSLHSWVKADEKTGEAMNFVRLSDIMHQFNRTRIDLLKIDIEGYEYEVLEDLLRDSIPVTQICVEIHQEPQVPGRTRKDRWRLINALRSAGYALLYHKHWDHTFYLRRH
jgi:FkbM family methyltransferase